MAEPARICAPICFIKFGPQRKNLVSTSQKFRKHFTYCSKQAVNGNLFVVAQPREGICSTFTFGHSTISTLACFFRRKQLNGNYFFLSKMFRNCCSGQIFVLGSNERKICYFFAIRFRFKATTIPFENHTLRIYIKFELFALNPTFRFSFRMQFLTLSWRFLIYKVEKLNNSSGIFSIVLSFIVGETLCSS